MSASSASGRCGSTADFLRMATALRSGALDLLEAAALRGAPTDPDNSLLVDCMQKIANQLGVVELELLPGRLE